MRGSRCHDATAQQNNGAGRRKSSRAPAAVLFAAVLLAAAVSGSLLISSCGRYYSGEIAGYVKDAESDEGINGAVVKLFLTEEEVANEEYVVKTASMTSNGNDGYFSHKIIWQQTFGEFGAEGDSGEIWLTAEHEDYQTVSMQINGILSDTINVIPDIVMERATFEVPEVRGRVVDVNGDGVNGVRVVLDLDSTAEEAEDYVTTTATVDGDIGTYQFENVTWKDEEAAGQNSDDEPATISVDDNQYTGDTALSITLTSGQEREVTDEIVVTRKPRTDFSTRVTGQVIRRITTAEGTDDIPIQGLEIKCTFDDNGGGTTTLWDQTDINGSYSFFIQWEDTFPGDYDVEGNNDGPDDESIPEGEDGLLITVIIDPEGVKYDATDTTPNDGFPDLDNPSPRYFENFKVKSWLNPNYLPDSIDDT
jgi:hypothetical protein